jgi:glycosyltransferase involved in cell wall biosynthesis
MKILYDHQTFTIQQYGGISRYFYEIISRNSINFEFELSCLFSNNVYLESHENKLANNFLPNYNFFGKTRFMKFVNETYSMRKIKGNNYDLFHPTYYSTYFLKHIGKKPFVVTFYDMIHEKFSNQFVELKLDRSLFFNKIELIKRANKVIAISEQTKSDIIEFYKVPGDNIHVVYLGNSLINIDFSSKRFIEYDYLLFVGNRGLYKNFDKFVKSVRDLLIKYDLYLICVGGGDFTDNERVLLKSLDISNRVLHKSFANDQELANFYSNALFFSFPSLYEGFGIPVLEAFASKSPVLLSHSGSLPEIAAEAADYFNPNDEYSIHKATENLINDSKRRNELIDLGTKRLTKFSWEKTFKETLNVYHEVLSI